MVAGNPVLLAPVRFDALGQFEASLGASVIGTTVVRTRGYIACGPSAAEAVAIRATAYVGEDADFPVGVNDNAFGELAQNRDYFLYEPFVVTPTETAASTDVSKRLIDVKSSRKIEELNQTIFLELSGLTETATDQSLVQVDLSMLLMLP